MSDTKHRQIPEVLKTYHARVVRIRDADTAILLLDHKTHHELGFEERVAIRLLEVDTPEMEDRRAWDSANKAADEWLAEGVNEWYQREKDNWPFVVEKVALEKFGRTLGYVWRKSDRACLNDHLIALGHSERVPVKVHLDRLGASPIHEED